MSTLDKIVDRIPYSDGGFRRRMTAGSIVSVTIGITIWGLIGSAKLFEIIASSDVQNIIHSPGLLAIILVLTYAIGGTIEVFSELFVARIAGNIAWSVQWLRAITAIRFKVMGESFFIIHFHGCPVYSHYQSHNPLYFNELNGIS